MFNIIENHVIAYPLCIMDMQLHIHYANHVIAYPFLTGSF